MKQHFQWSWTLIIRYPMLIQCPQRTENANIGAKEAKRHTYTQTHAKNAKIEPENKLLKCLLQWRIFDIVLSAATVKSL